MLAIKIITTFQLTLITSNKMPLYTRHNIAHAAAFRAKTPFYILWRSDLWRFSQTPHMYKVAFIIDALYKKKMSPYTRFFVVFHLSDYNFSKFNRLGYNFSITTKVKSSVTTQYQTSSKHLVTTRLKYIIITSKIPH